MRGDPRAYWAFGLALGILVGLPVLSFGPRLLLLGVGMVGLAFVAARSLAFVSGAAIGMGGSWLAMLIRAQLACDAFNTDPNRACESSGIEPWALLGVLVIAFGLLLGGISWRRRQARKGRDVRLRR